jgi:hypothetical protein
MQEIVSGIFQWSWFSQEKGYDFNGHVIISEDGRVIIDPPPLSHEDFTWLEGNRPYQAILLTNRDHTREAEPLRKKLYTPIYAPEVDAPLMNIQVDHTYRDGDTLPAGLTAIHIPDNKSPGESALLMNTNGGILFLGDAMIGVPAGQLNLMPSDKYKEFEKARQGLRVLLEHSFDKILVGDGVSLLKDGKKVLGRFLSS